MSDLPAGLPPLPSESIFRGQLKDHSFERDLYGYTFDPGHDKDWTGPCHWSGALHRPEDDDAQWYFCEAVRADDCQCTMSQKLVGDGCRVCNPELAAEMAAEQLHPPVDPSEWGGEIGQPAREGESYTPERDALWAKHDGLSPSLAAEMCVLAGKLERERDRLRDLLRRVSTESFYGDSTGYHHVGVNLVSEIRKALSESP